MDLLYLLMLLIPLLAQIYVSSSYKRYKGIKNNLGYSGYDVAKNILENNGLGQLYIVETAGKMTDHYDPIRKTVKLSKEVYHGSSIASIAIAAHECGHAIQDKEGYLFMKIRSLIFPVVNLGTRFAYIILLIGIIFEIMNLIWVAIMLVGLGLVFQLITLPVEIDASRKALGYLKELNLTDEQGSNGSKTMLNAAALTYVAGVIASALEILRLIMIFTDRRD